MSDTTLLTAEQRIAPRVAFDALAVLSRDGARIGDFRVENLSSGGAYVTGDSLPPPIGEPVDVLLKASQLGVISLRAKVVRCTTSSRGLGIGLEFCRAASHIEDLIVDAVITELRKLRVIAA